MEASVIRATVSAIRAGPILRNRNRFAIRGTSFAIRGDSQLGASFAIRGDPIETEIASKRN